MFFELGVTVTPPGAPADQITATSTSAAANTRSPTEQKRRLGTSGMSRLWATIAGSTAKKALDEAKV